MSWQVRVRVPSEHVERISSHLWDNHTNGIAELTTDSETIRELVAGFDQENLGQAAASSLTDMGELTGIVLEPTPIDWSTPSPTMIERRGVSATIEAGRAFGHGTHPTTELALDLVARLAEPGQSMLDVGTGSGVLAVVAALLGAQPVVAVDNDPEAVAVATSNAEKNNVEIDVHFSLDDATGTFDLVVANMLAADLEPLASAIVDRTTHTLALTGFLDEQVGWVTSMFPELTVVDRLDHQGWVGLVLQ